MGIRSFDEKWDEEEQANQHLELLNKLIKSQEELINTLLRVIEKLIDLSERQKV